MIHVEALNFSYKNKKALNGLSLEVKSGSIFGLLGPNGSGKSTLFRILSTMLKPAQGSVSIDGIDISKVHEVRKKIGIVFQSASLDLKLNVKENLTHQGHLYGLHGSQLQNRIREVAQSLEIEDRLAEKVEGLSGGLKRRVELAKGLIHHPKVLLLDEPSTGLDPNARIEFWNHLKTLKEKQNITVLVTTHLMDEAEHCDELAIINEGKLVCSGDPDRLKRELGKDILEVVTENTQTLAGKIKEKFNLEPVSMNGTIQLEVEDGAKFVAKIAEAFPGTLESVTFRKPTLEDVFIHHTGKQFNGKNIQ